MIITKIAKVKVEDFSSEKIEKAILKCNEGAIYLNQALEEKSNLILVKSLDAFEESINLNSKAIEPYLALAYISWQMDKNAEALKFVSRALEIDPKNEKVKQLFNKISSDKQKTAISKIITDYSKNKSNEKIKLNTNTLDKLKNIFDTKKSEKDLDSAVSINFPSLSKRV